MKYSGKVKFFLPLKGFGFIIPDNRIQETDGKDIFFHVSEIKDKSTQPPIENDVVVFEVEITDKGVKAINCEFSPIV